MKSSRKIVPSFLHPNRPLMLKGIGRPRIHGREAFAYLLALTLGVATVGGFLAWHITRTYQQETAALRACGFSVAYDQAQRVSDWLVEYNDYQGVPVLAATRYIPVTGWGLVRKTDPAEALQDVRRMAIFEGLAAGLLIILLGGLLLFHRREVLTRVLSIVRDISERKRAEEALRESEQFNREVIASAQEGVAVYDHELRYQVWNHSMEELTGVPASEALGKQAFDLFPHLREQKVDLLIRRALAGEVVHGPDTPFRVPTTGKSGWVSGVYSPHFGASGQIHGVIGTIRDITERKRAEEALRESEAAFRTLAEAMPQLVWMCTPDGLNIYFNQRWVDYTGLSLEESYGRGWNTPFHPDDKQPAWDAWNHAVESGDTYSIECRLRRADDTYHWFLTRGVPLRDAQGGIVKWFGTCTEIDELKRAEEALIEERHLLHTLMDNLPDKIYFKDRESHFTRMNKVHTKLFGLSDPAQAAGKTDFDFFTPEHAQEAYKDEQEIIRTGQPVVGKEEMETWPDGHVTWVSTTKMPLRDAGGNIIGTFGVSRDITERKRAEEALRDSEERFRTLITDARVAIGVARNGITLFVNTEYARLFGLQDPEETFGRSILDQHAPQCHEWMKDRIRRREQGVPAPTDFESIGRRKDGSTFPMHCAVSQINLADGPVTLGFLTDLTERKRAEEALRESEERYRTLFENSPVGIYRTTADGRILAANPALIKMLGYANFEELTALNLEEEGFAPGYSRRTFRELIERDGEVKGLESAWARRDGSMIFVRESARVVRDESGNVLCYDGIVEDITDRRQLEQQLIQAQKMEAVGRLAGGVAHDFNNLLTIINGYAQLLAKRSSPEDPRQRQFNEILMAGERAASLTGQLLAFGRRQVLNPIVVDLSSVLADTEEMLRRLIGEDVELVTTLRPDLGRVKVDPGQIEQVIMNLAVNARDAMPEGGKFLIETSNVEVDEDFARRHSNMAPGKYVVLAATDTGCGMDQETQARIFEPFFTTKGQGKGTGLGLATVYGIVKQSGGFIWVHSEPGRGSTFKIYFPCLEVEERTAEPAKVLPKPPKGKETVLVVEDEGGVRSLVCETLASYGYRVLEASGGGQALQIAEQHAEPIHLLLTDVVMPQISGKELAKRFFTLHSETRVLYMSGYTDDVVVRQGILQGGAAFLQKPFSPDALLLKVRDVLKMTPGTKP